jgi:hypothetical protein
MNMILYLDVPYAEKDLAKSHGARWDPTRKRWYTFDTADLRPLLKWVPEHLKKPVNGGSKLSDPTALKKPIKQNRKNRRAHVRRMQHQPMEANSVPRTS